jgi:beta-aspartyl-peptidase (threonine type)
MKRILFFISAVTLTATLGVASIAHGRRNNAPQSKLGGQDAKTIAAIRSVLDAQVAAWNRGDIDGFMDGYWRSPETVFVSGDSVTHGWQTVLERYKKGYDTREKMGTLTFSDLEIKPIGKDAAVVLGRWQLTRAEGGNPHGRFTLIFRHVAQGWRIVHDHTSSG